MNLTEIRINNWLNICEEETQVTGVIQFGIYMSDGYCPNIGEFIKPIPLTEEWLIKFGFDANKSFYKKGNYFELINISNKYFRAYNRYRSIEKDVEYVHQLQNLYFALTGQELIIK